MTPVFGLANLSCFRHFHFLNAFTIFVPSLHHHHLSDHLNTSLPTTLVSRWPNSSRMGEVEAAEPANCHGGCRANIPGIPCQLSFDVDKNHELFNPIMLNLQTSGRQTRCLASMDRPLDVMALIKLTLLTPVKLLGTENVSG